MDYKKTTAPANTITRDMISMAEETGNIYETVRIIGKRANEVSVDIKHDLENKLLEFSSYSDSLEEIFENREQIEISRYFERLPKPTLIAIQEFVDHEVYYRNPIKDKDKLEDL
jgi:DNA-directed RNA polymerase subunit K/omega